MLTNFTEKISAMQKYISCLFSCLMLFSILAQEKELTVEKIWSEYRFFPSGVDGFRSMKDGEFYTRFTQKEGFKSILKYNFTQTGVAGEVLAHGKDFKYDNELRKADDYQFNEQETKLLIATNKEKKYRRSYTAEYFIFDIETKSFVPLDQDHSPQTLARFSPDGKKIAYIHNNNIFVKNLEDNFVFPVTTDGKTNEIINGTTDWVYEEEFAITQAFDWSPDSRYIAFLKFDERHVKEFTMTYHFDLYPDLYTFKYPKAGEDNSKVTLHLRDLNDNTTAVLEVGEYEYIPRLQWSPIDNLLLVRTLNRHQNHLKILAFNESNNWKSSVIYEETDDAYVEIDDNLLFLPDNKNFLITSERDGFNHIYKIGVDGKTEQITRGNWDVIDLKGINEKNKTIYFSSSASGAINKDLVVTNFKGKKTKTLSKTEGTTNATFSNGMRYYVQSWSDANTPPIFTLHKGDGSLIDTLEGNEILNFELEQYGFQPKTFTQLKGVEDDLNAWMIYPPNFDETKKYPVYFNVYCGPGSNMVSNSFGSANFAYHQLLAKNGYIVVSVDTRGTMNRGAKFKKSTYLQLGKLETEDLIAVAKNLREKPYVDADRIGVMGWSYGGYMASLAVTKGADIFKMGIAVAPVTNWRFYDNIYTERFMRTPQENPDGYDDNSPINHVDKLKGNYFIIHGSGDDNVHYQNTMEMIKALVKADKQFDLFIYPNKDHGIYGGNTRNHLFQLMLDYTLKNL